MAIAHVVVDIPLDEHFDYLIPDHLVDDVVVGSRVKITFTSRSTIGIVIGLAQEAAVDKTIKPIKDVLETTPFFNRQDLEFAKTFSAYYGASLGQTLTMMARHRRNPIKAIQLEAVSKTTVYYCPGGANWTMIEPLVKGRADAAVIVPDAAVANQLGVPKEFRRMVGLRSSMFQAFGQCGLLVVIDEDNPSFKQEQSPMYETRQVMLLAQRIYGFELVFSGASPSVELMQLVTEKKAQLIEMSKETAAVKVIDTSNYKFLDKGVLSVPVRNALEANQKAGRQSILVLNRRGTFAVTRCEGCGHILKCPRCDTSMTYSRLTKSFDCRYCHFQTDAAGPCPQCQAQAWKSFGLGVDGVQKELTTFFPQMRIAHLDKETATLPKTFDVLIATQAVLRFKGSLLVETIAWIDIDAQLNRMDMRSSFGAWAKVMQLKLMAAQMMVQTQNPKHHVLTALSKNDPMMFYQDELALRRELQFDPFYHWAEVVARSKTEKNAQEAAEDVYNQLVTAKVANIKVQSAVPDTPAKLRDQFRFKVLVGGADAVAVVAAIKAALKSIKKRKTIITINIDP